MWRLENGTQRYAWGSRTALSALLGREASGEPEAELWLGAHPSLPSIAAGVGPLDAAIAGAAPRLLGAGVAARAGSALPFLLKVLAVEQPLSLQAHPSKAQAEAGLAREERAGLPRTAATRNYKDANHKPELVCALTPFDALCGFRAVPQTQRLLAALDVGALAPGQRALDARPDAQGLEAFFRWAMTLPLPERRALADQVAQALARDVAGFEGEVRWARALAAAYPQDVGVVGALLLNLVRLEPGQALYLPAGNLHAYLRGTAVEVMASSDNVLRGGLTPKHVDVDELLRVLVFGAGPVAVLEGRGAPEQVYETPALDFRLSRLTVRGPVAVRRWSADLLLCVDGDVTARAAAGALPLGRGQAAFVGLDDGPLELDGEGTIFRATVQEGFGA